MTFKRCLAVLAILALAALPALAKPNFSGDWKLNLSKSSFGQMPAPSGMTNKITHEDPKLTSHVKQSGEMGEFEFELAQLAGLLDVAGELRIFVGNLVRHAARRRHLAEAALGKVQLPIAAEVGLGERRQGSQRKNCEDRQTTFECHKDKSFELL